MSNIEQTRGWIVAGALGLGMVGTATSCLRVNDEHCMFNGGDVACPGAFCVAAVEGGSEALAAVRADGCSDEDLGMDDPGIAYVKYGLIADDAELQAVLAGQNLEAGCDETVDVAFLGGVESDLRSRGRTRRAKASLTAEQRTSIHDLNSAIDDVIAACGGEQTTESTTTVSETTTTGETDSASGTTTGIPECIEDVDCMDPELPMESALPLCGPDGKCVQCTDPSVDGDAGCAAVGMVCSTEGSLAGRCVECTADAADACTGVPPMCDMGTNTCSPCTEHDQCGEAACNLFTGACLPEDAVVHVGPGQMFTTIGAAVGSFEAEAEGTIIVHPNPASYNESVTVDQGRVVAFLAVEIGGGAEVPRWVRTMGTLPQLAVNDATMLMDGLQLSGNVAIMAPGLLVNGGRAWLDRSHIINNDGGGIRAQSGAELVVRNCFVGGDVSDHNALEVNGAMADVLYTTLGAGFGTATALTCDAMATVGMRNALMVARTDTNEVMCNATIEFSAAEFNFGRPNKGLGDMNTNWFQSYGAGDFHLAPMQAPDAIDTAAQWQTNDPPTDIDGDLRPTQDGSADHAGADVP